MSTRHSCRRLRKTLLFDASAGAALPLHIIMQMLLFSTTMAAAKAHVRLNQATQDFTRLWWLA
eukprot:4775051-Pleurochrysis_carterae.AAC.1